MEFVVLFAVLFGIIFFTFSSAFSAIPFFPTSGHDLPNIIKKFNLEDDQVIIDLGAGTGTVIFAAATEAHQRGLNTEFIAIDINFLLVVYLFFRTMFHPHKKHIRIMQGDLFKMDYEKMVEPFKKVVYYMYVSPWYTDPLAQLIINTNKPARILSYYYPITFLEKHDQVSEKHDVFEYKIQ